MPVFRHRAPREPGPERFVIRDAVHFKRKKPALRLVDGDDANALRFDPFKPQKLPISMPENHRKIPLRGHYTKNRNILSE